MRSIFHCLALLLLVAAVCLTRPPRTAPDPPPLNSAAGSRRPPIGAITDRSAAIAGEVVLDHGSGW